MPSITSANSIYTISVATIFPTPQRLRGFAADDMFTNEAIPTAEVAMGVDGRLSAGFIFVPFVQQIMLMADSPSNDLFDQWFAQQQLARDVYHATGLVQLPSTGKKYNLVRGFLTSYKPIPDARKKLEARTFGVTWQRPAPANN